ncbi:MAG: BlaI/MecI/CopY family transcriptional regulator [bacterium]|nr:BlaI/MecI/CopY family transcriptional regulator [bacterium]
MKKRTTKPELPQPTEAELVILEVLWDRGPSTVRDVYETLQREGKTRSGYTTTLKLMQIMAQKGLVERDETRRTHVYESASSREATRKRLVGTLIERVFSGSTSQLVLSALSAKRTSRKELDAIRAFLDEQGQGKRGKS